MFEFAMPSLGADMEAGTVLEWYVTPGHVVRRGDIVALVDTEKAEIEVEIWDAGRVERILVEPGREVPVGTPLLVLDEASASPITGTPADDTTAPSRRALEPAPVAAMPAKAATLPSPRPAVPISKPAPAPPQPESQALPQAVGRDRVRATPLARRLAREQAVDLRRVVGTGPGGRVRADDVRAAATVAGRSMPARATAVAPSSSAPATPAPAQPLSAARLSAIQRGMASAMARSKREIPHYYLSLDVDLTRTLAWLETANRERPVEKRLILQVLLLKASARALAHVPDLNGHWLEDRFVPATNVHLGVAITVRGGGLLAPALHDVDRRGLDDLMHDLSDLVARARRAQLRSSEVRDATATVTSLTDRGPDRVFGVIYPPQVALIGFGSIRERPWADAGMLGVRPVLTVSLSADHRASDGHRGTRLLRQIARALDTPEELA